MFTLLVRGTIQSLPEAAGMKNSRIGESADLLLVVGHILLYAQAQARQGDPGAVEQNKSNVTENCYSATTRGRMRHQGITTFVHFVNIVR